MTQVSIDDFRTNLADIMGKVMYGNDRVIIKKYNREAAILISIDDFERLTDPTKRFTRDEWDEKFNVFEEIKKKNTKKKLSAIENDIAKAVKEVRAQKHER